MLPKIVPLYTAIQSANTLSCVFHNFTHIKTVYSNSINCHLTALLYQVYQDVVCSSQGGHEFCQKKQQPSSQTTYSREENAEKEELRNSSNHPQDEYQVHDEKLSDLRRMLFLGELTSICQLHLGPHSLIQTDSKYLSQISEYFC